MAKYVVCSGFDCKQKVQNPHPRDCPKCGTELLVSAGAPLAEDAKPKAAKRRAPAKPRKRKAKA